ncbi:MAG: universal stress protein [Candidatus Bipolaricaulota bacterium]
MNLQVLYYNQGTQEDKAALRYIASLLGHAEGTLDLLYVTEEASAVANQKRWDLAVEQRSQKEISSSEKALDDAQDILTTMEMVTTAEDSEGDPVKKVKAALKRKHYDLLVLAAFGRGGFSKDVIGAHAKPLVQQFGVPVLLHKGKLESCERVLIHVPADKDLCTQFMHYMTRLLGNSPPALTLLSIIKPGHQHFEGYTSAEDQRLTKALADYDRDELDYLETAECVLESEGFQAEIRHRNGDMTEELLNEAKEGRYDLMAFAPEEHGTLMNMWYGDESFEIMRDVEISVLKFPASFEGDSS